MSDEKYRPQMNPGDCVPQGPYGTNEQMMPADRKYKSDPQFKALVDTMIGLIYQQKTSFSEIREAALFAQLKYELDNPGPRMTLSPDLQAELARRVQNWG